MSAFGLMRIIVRATVLLLALAIPLCALEGNDGYQSDDNPDTSYMSDYVWNVSIS